ncbi:MAG: tRNA pseudouridine(38-40) synthase TruA [Bacteroidales bacterium]|nr:tRNA pseudouridine(38-40) synthase TruA [Bacteroidales bacterium]MBN2820145.1 tRNA pseudouridine(38-40) synthase TruA [Bacteroidales bacterium]
MNRYFIHLAYNGKNYNGWQIQPNSPSIQETLQKALEVLFREPVQLTGCGRTDTGVHARNFYAHFDSKQTSIDSDQKIIFKLNSILPDDIKIYAIHNMLHNAHARFDANKRTYKYYISKGKEIFFKDLVWQNSLQLNIELMNKAASLLKNYSDFTSFSKLHSDTKTNNCNISEAYWIQQEERIIFTIKADRFLRNMVRAIVGTLIDVGKEKISLEEFCRIIEDKNRMKAGTSVPASGLFLEEIQYPYLIPNKPDS